MSGVRQARLRAWGPRLATSAVVAVLLFFLVNGDVYLDLTESLPLPASVTFTLGSLLILFWGWRSVPDATAAWRRAVSAVAWILAAMLLLSLCRLLGAFLPGAAWDTGAKHVFLSLFDTFVFAAMVMAGSLRSLHRLNSTLFAGAMLVLVLTITIDLFVPGSFSRDLTRGAGLAVNANAAAFFVVVLLACSLDWRRFRLRDAVLVTAGSIGVLVTLSRGGVVLLALLLTAHLTTTVIVPLLAGRAGALRRLLLLVCAALIFIGAAAVAFERTPFFAQSTARHRALSFLGRSALVSRDESRLRIAREYWALIREKPVLGHGTAYTTTRERGTHNMYLMVWVENGIGGVLAYAAWLGAVLHFFVRRRRRAGVALGAILVTVSLVDHAVLDHRVSMIALGLLAGRVAMERREPR